MLVKGAPERNYTAYLQKSFWCCYLIRHTGNMIFLCNEYTKDMSLVVAGIIFREIFNLLVKVYKVEWIYSSKHNHPYQQVCSHYAGYHLVWTQLVKLRYIFACDIPYRYHGYTMTIKFNLLHPFGIHWTLWYQTAPLTVPAKYSYSFIKLYWSCCLPYSDFHLLWI